MQENNESHQTTANIIGFVALGVNGVALIVTIFFSAVNIKGITAAVDASKFADSTFRKYDTILQETKREFSTLHTPFLQTGIAVRPNDIVGKQFTFEAHTFPFATIPLYIDRATFGVRFDTKYADSAFIIKHFDRIEGLEKRSYKIYITKEHVLVHWVVSDSIYKYSDTLAYSRGNITFFMRIFYKKEFKDKDERVYIFAARMRKWDLVYSYLYHGEIIINENMEVKDYEKQKSE